MLKTHEWLNYLGALETELQQSAEEGKNVGSCAKMVEEINRMDPEASNREEKIYRLLDELNALPVAVKDYPYREPSELEEIRRERPEHGKNLKLNVPAKGERDLYGRLYGAWLGRSAGCLLGKPLECMMKDRIQGICRDTGNYPVRYYVSSDVPEEVLKKYDMLGHFAKDAYINMVSYMPEDDDMNYTILGLKILETYGRDFTPEDVAERWLSDLPILHLATAELVAYKNIVNRLYPPKSATFRNPYREWIGAQIRGDFFGYVNPGNPEMAAEMAWRDASISHVKNGIYGEMFVAAMLAGAAVVSDPRQVIEIGLSQIPDKCRLAEKIRWLLGWKEEGLTWEQAIDRIHETYDETNRHHAVHTISNALIVCMSLLYGELDFEKSIGISALSAFDTDCNGATVGSIVGMMLGAKALPEKWIEPLKDTIKSGVDGFGLVKISELAERTLRFTK